MNEKRNIISGISVQILMIIINLISKNAIKNTLGLDYLGLQSVFLNFCDIFTFAFLGLGTSFLHRLYKPIEENDYNTVNNLYTIYNRIFSQLALGVFFIGGLSSFLVLAVINADIPQRELIITYFLCLLSTILYSRFSIMNYAMYAKQKRYIISSILGIFEILFLFIQVPILYMTQNYYLFMLIFLGKNVVVSLVILFYCRLKNKEFRIQRYNPDSSELKSIYHDIRHLVITRIGAIMVHNTDSILISYLISTTISGLYANYFFVYMGVVIILSVYCDSTIGKIGNHIVTSTKEELFQHYKRDTYLQMWITGVCVTAFYYLVQDFITLWMGKNALLPLSIVVLLSINLYLGGIRITCYAYRTSAGVFAKISSSFILRGIINLILSFIGGIYWGLNGILLATAISNLLSTFFYESYVFYKYLEKPYSNDLKLLFIGILGVLGSITITGIFLSDFSGTTIPLFILKGFLCGIITNIYYLIFYLLHQLKQKLT